MLVTSWAAQIGRRRVLALLAALAAAGLARLPAPRLASGARQTLPPEAIETADGAFFPHGGGLTGFYVRNVPNGPQFWSFYDAAGGHSWYGPPLSRAWSDANAWYQLFANALFSQPKSGGAAGLAPMVELIVTGPPVSSSFSNATKLEFDGWPKHGAGPSVDDAIRTFVGANPALQTGAARSAPRSVAGKVRNLFANVGLERSGSHVRLGALGQRYKHYFQGRASRLPSDALALESFELGDQTAGISDDLPGTVKGADRGFGCTLASEEGVAAGIDHMNRLGLWWDREQFLWGAMTDYSGAALPAIATDRNFRVSKQVVGLLQFTPAYAGGGPSEPQKYNPPSGLHLPAAHSSNHFGRFVRGVVESRKPIPNSSPRASASGLNPISRWIPWNEPDICRPSMPGYAWGGVPHKRWVDRTGGSGAPLDGELDDAGREQALFRLVQVAFDAMIAADPQARLIFPTLGLVDRSCDDTPRQMKLWDGWVRFLASQQNRAALVANGFFFHDVSLALHKEPERVYEMVANYRQALDGLAASVGATDPLAGSRRLIVMEAGLEDDPGLGAHFDDTDTAHFIIQTMANALAAGADELALHKLADYPMSSDAGKGARVAVRYMSHVTRQHPGIAKRPNIRGEQAANAYAGPVRIDLPGPGFVTSVFYNRQRQPLDLTLTFASAAGADASAPSIHLSNHAGAERTLGLGAHTLTLAAPRHTFNAYGKNWAWVGGGTHVVRYPDTVTLRTTPSIPAAAAYRTIRAIEGASAAAAS